MTLKRAWSNMGIKEKMKLMFSLFLGFFEEAEDEEEDIIEKLQDKDIVNELLNELAKEIPSVKETLIDERDRYIASKIIESEGKKIVAVVGRGHMDGIKRALGNIKKEAVKEEIAPGHIVFPDQFIDFTKKREYTFFDEGKVIHTSTADPFSDPLRKILIDGAKRLGLKYHKKGTVITIEGPRFSTRAESHMFRLLGADIINMSTVPEVSLAKEAGLEYATIAMSTDYDCWKENEEPVTFEMVMKTMKNNSENVKKLILDVIPRI